MSFRWLAVFVVLGILVQIAPARPAAQTASDKSDFLIAKREMLDPLFAKAVILMFPRKDQDIVVGLIVNKPSRIHFSDIFPKDSALKNRPDPVYFGGPVDATVVDALIRSAKPPKQSVLVTAGIYFTFDSSVIKAMLKNPTQAANIRIFLGRSQWDPAQLQNEMDRGSWFREQEENKVIFSPQPGDVWPSLIELLDPGSMV